MHMAMATGYRQGVNMFKHFTVAVFVQTNTSRGVSVFILGNTCELSIHSVYR
jgi:hypothetical protein